MSCESTMNIPFSFGGAFGGDDEAPDGASSRTPAAPRQPASSPDAAKLAEQARFESLIRRMNRGDEAALATLYDATAGRVYGFALRILGNPAAAEEVASDVFLQAWKDAGRYDAGRARVLTWLLMICRSRALDRLRARPPEIPTESPEALVTELPGDGSPQDLLEATESGSAVRAAIERLTPVQRQLIGLAFFRGLSHQEIAAHVQLPLGTVKSHLRRALEALRVVLGLSETP